MSGVHRSYIISGVENYSIFRRFYPKKHSTKLLFTRVWRRYSGNTDSYRGGKYFQFCKKASQKCNGRYRMSFFICVIPASGTIPNCINGVRYGLLKFCFLFEHAGGGPTFVYDDTLCTNIIRNDIGSHVKRKFACGGCKTHTLHT